MSSNRQDHSTRTLVVDVGGSNIKMIATGQSERIKIPSGPELTPDDLVKLVGEATSEWPFDRLSIGLPCVVKEGQVARNPVNLGPGWVGFDLKKAFHLPCHVLNDAAMQAYGCYQGGTMLFLGLGTGLGTTLIVDGSIVPLEAGHLPYRKGRSFEEYVGKAGLKEKGQKKWEEHVNETIRILCDAFNAEDVVIGGGNAKLLEPLPKGARRTDNSAAFLGGFRLWEEPALNLA